MYRLLWLVTFAIGAPLALVAATVSLVTLAPYTTPDVIIKPQVLSAATPILEPYTPQIPSLSAQAFTADARPILIKNYLDKYDSPLQPFATRIVELGDKYQVDPNLLVAIAQQESNLCKRIPSDSYNCWGYGIYGDKVTRFEDYPAAIETVASGLRKNYLDKGLLTPEQIMAKYTPPSVEIGGPWARGVQQFMDELQ